MTTDTRPNATSDPSSSAAGVSPAGPVSSQIEDVQAQLDQARRAHGIRLTGEPIGRLVNIHRMRARSLSSDEAHAARVHEFERAQAARDEKAHRERARNLLAASQAPALHLEACRRYLDTDTPWAAKAKRLLARLAGGAGTLVAMLGARGTGKTQLAIAAIAGTCDRGLPARYIDARMLFMAIRDGMGRHEEVATYQQFLRPHLLVIDQLEERKDSPAELQMLFTIVDGRYAALRDTIVITNETAEAFEHAIGASIVDRIRERGRVIKCDWPSFRLAGAVG